MSSAGLNIEDLRRLVQKDLQASNELQHRIDQIRKEVEAGATPDSKELSLMGGEHKQIGRDLVARIEEIEQQKKNLAAADRNMLQALTARLGVHDLQSARLAELGDLRSGREWLEGEEGSQDARPLAQERKKSDRDQDRGIDDVGVGKWEQNTPLGRVLEPANTPPGGHDLGSRSASMPQLYMRDDAHLEDEANHSDQCQYGSEDEDEDDEELDKSDWPLLYRILDIDPNTPDYLFNDRLNKCYEALELKHHPGNFPNDPAAPERWDACSKAYAILADPSRKTFYDLHGKVPKDLQGFDVSKLEKMSISG